MNVHWSRGDGSRLIKGAVGVAKAALGVQAAAPDVVQERWATCLACEAHDCGRCKACGCFTGAKVRLANESCPQGKWVAVGVTTSAPQGCSGKRGNLDNPVSDL